MAKLKPKGKYLRLSGTEKKAVGQRRFSTKIKSFKCEGCLKSFSLLASIARAREKTCRIKFCSWICYAKSIEVKMARCVFCKREFNPWSKESRFCSKACFGKDKLGKPHSKKTPGFWFESGYKVKQVDGSPIKEHRLIMEKIIGRKLLPSEHVHHINEKRGDNRPENLLLVTKGEHSRIHREMELSQGKNLFGGMH